MTWHAEAPKWRCCLHGSEDAREADRLTDAAACSRAMEKQIAMAVKTIGKSTAAKMRGRAERHESIYRQLRIVAGSVSGRSVAIAYQGGKRFLQAEAADVPTAVSELQKDIDELHAQREARRLDGVPSPEEYADALLRIDRFINPVQHAALHRHAARLGAWASFKELASQLDTETELIQRAYTRIGRYLAEILNYQPETEDLRKPLKPVLVLAEPREDDGELAWVLRPNLVAALKAEAANKTACRAA